MPITYSFTSAPTRDQLEVVDRVLDEFNMGHEALRDVQRLSVFAEDDQRKIIGGAVGRTWGACCELQQLVVREEYRNRGIGRQLLQRFEGEAAVRGCTLVYLDTFSFQAPQFYQQHGYHVALETPGFTGGVFKYTMQKLLSGPQTES